MLLVGCKGETLTPTAVPFKERQQAKVKQPQAAPTRRVNLVREGRKTPALLTVESKNLTMVKFLKRDCEGKKSGQSGDHLSQNGEDKIRCWLSLPTTQAMLAIHAHRAMHSKT